MWFYNHFRWRIYISKQWCRQWLAPCTWFRAGLVVYDDGVKWKHFPRYWPFVRGIHRSPVNSPHKGQWRGALMFSLFCAWINGRVNNRETGDLRRHRAHYDVIVINWTLWVQTSVNLESKYEAFHSRKCFRKWPAAILYRSQCVNLHWICNNLLKLKLCTTWHCFVDV